MHRITSTWCPLFFFYVLSVLTYSVWSVESLLTKMQVPDLGLEPKTLPAKSLYLRPFFFSFLIKRFMMGLDQLRHLNYAGTLRNARL